MGLCTCSADMMHRSGYYKIEKERKNILYFKHLEKFFLLWLTNKLKIINKQLYTLALDAFVSLFVFSLK